MISHDTVVLSPKELSLQLCRALYHLWACCFGFLPFVHCLCFIFEIIPQCTSSPPCSVVQCYWTYVIRWSVVQSIYVASNPDGVNISSRSPKILFLPKVRFDQELGPHPVPAGRNFLLLEQQPATGCVYQAVHQSPNVSCQAVESSQKEYFKYWLRREGADHTGWSQSARSQLSDD